MKKTITTLVFAIIVLITNAQTPNWQWAKNANGTLWDEGISCSADTKGNIFVTGHFASSSITFGTTTLTNMGSFDMFMVKYDSTGNVLWAKSAGGTSSDEGRSCSADAAGNIYVTGYFESSSITFGTTTLTNVGPVGTYDMFMVKYDSIGNVLWAKSAAGTSYNEGYGCSADANGNIFVTGYFRSSSITFGTTTLTNVGAGIDDIFIVKYDPTGNVLWAKSAGGTSSDYGYGCSADANGDIFVTGSFYSPSITFGTDTLTNASPFGTNDMFIVKYDSIGNVLWAKSAGGSSYSDVGRSCSADTSGNIFVMGSFESPSSITFGTTTLTSVGIPYSVDMFIVKYDSTGNIIWAKSAEGDFNDEGQSCSADANGNIFVTGSFYSSSITFGTTTLTNVGGQGGVDMFTVKYDSIGNVLWVKSAGVTSDDYGYGCSADANGNIFVTGSFTSSSITFGTTSLTNMGAGYADMFIAKLEGSSTSITEINKEIEVAIFPNPTSGEFNVSSSKFKIQRVEIYNVYGEKIYSTTLNAPVETLNLSDKPSGIYFLHLKTEQGRAIQKLIIQK